MAQVSRTTVSFVLNERAGIKIPDETRQRVLARGGRASTTTRTRWPASWPAAPAAASGSSCASRPSRSPTTASWPRRCAGWPARPGRPSTGCWSRRSFPARAATPTCVRSGRADGLDRVRSALRRRGAGRARPRRLPGRDPGIAARARTCPSVDVDNEAGARLAVEHLLALGHRRIACITNAPLAYTAASERLAGYREALAARRRRRGARRSSPRARSTRPAAIARWPRSWRGPTPDAIFVASDVVAIGAIAGLREAGLSRAGRRLRRRLRRDPAGGLPRSPADDHHACPPTTWAWPPAGRILDRIAGRPGRRADPPPHRTHRSSLHRPAPRGGATARLTTRAVRPTTQRRPFAGQERRSAVEISSIKRRRLVAGLVASALVVGACSSGGALRALPSRRRRV